MQVLALLSLLFVSAMAADAGFVVGAGEDPHGIVIGAINTILAATNGDPLAMATSLIQTCIALLTFAFNLVVPAPPGAPVPTPFNPYQ